MRLDKIRPSTRAKFEKAYKLVKEGLDHNIACQRAEISMNWFFKIRRALEESINERKAT